MGAILTILYLFRVFNMVFLGEMKTPVSQEGSRVMLFSVILFALLSLVTGILIYYPSKAVETITQQMMKVIP